MTINARVQSSVYNSRVLQKGEEKGQTKHTVLIQLYNDQSMVASSFQLNVETESQGRDLVAKYPHGTEVQLRFVPYETVYIKPEDLSLLKK